jgi:hypothetical protein
MIDIPAVWLVLQSVFPPLPPGSRARVIWEAIQNFFSSVPPGESYLGYVVFAIFISPPIILLASSIIGTPRSGRVVTLLTATLAVGLIAFIVTVYALSYLLHTLFFT